MNNIKCKCLGFVKCKNYIVMNRKINVTIVMSSVIKEVAYLVQLTNNNKIGILDMSSI